MKTLKQRLNQGTFTVSEEHCNKIINEVKEWLMQKRQEPKYQVTTLHLYNKQSAEQELFNELLEELQK